MAEQLSINRGKAAILIMDYQNRQLSSFSEEFRKEILRKANEVLVKRPDVLNAGGISSQREARG